MNNESGGTAAEGHEMIKVAGLSLNFLDATVASNTPDGAQIASAAGFNADQGATVLEVLANGELEDIRPDEVVGLADSTRKFVVVVSDRSFKLTLNGVQFEWPNQVISGGQIRKLGQVPAEAEVYLELSDDVERVIHEHDLVDLGAPGIEKLKTRKRQWRLNVQGVMLVIHHPTIIVREAIADAGFDPSKPWIIVLRVHGEPKREVTLDEVIDLRKPGIEKLRLTPKEVNNGEAPKTPRRMFRMLEVDERFLNGLGLKWETVIEHVHPNQQRRWLLIHRYPVPAGYTVDHTLLALEIPPTYPSAAIYGFYAHPPLALKSGNAIPSTQLLATIDGATFVGWSRHRGNHFPWNSETDNVVTHLSLVDAAMMKENGE